MSTDTVTTAASRPTVPTGDIPAVVKALLALIVPIGPFAVAVLRYVLPYDTTSSPEQVARGVLEYEGRESLVLWLGALATLTLAPAVLMIGRLLRPRAPRLTLAALCLLVPGYLALGLIVAADVPLWAGAHAGLDAPTLTTLAATQHPAMVLGEFLFVVGHVAGTVLLGVAMWRSRLVPRWAAAITAISQPLHFVAAVVLASHPLDLAAWSMNGVGFAAAAVAILRTPKDD